MVNLKPFMSKNLPLKLALERRNQKLLGLAPKKVSPSPSVPLASKQKGRNRSTHGKAKRKPNQQDSLFLLNLKAPTQALVFMRPK